MENVTDRTSNPFGMSPPCTEPTPGGHDAVFGYGDPNADFHVIGDNPRIHGGGESGVPFTGSAAGERLRGALAAAGLFDPDDPPGQSNVFFSYLHMCWPREDPPAPDGYGRLERFFDAELRAINAHVLLPVGERAIEYVLETHTSRVHESTDHHATEIRGRGYLVVPVREPTAWTEGDRDRLVAFLEALLASDYRQTSDLGRFRAGADPYWVR